MTVSAKYRMMQYNILHQIAGYATDKYLAMKLEDRKNAIVEIIQQNEPDVLFLAERFEEWAGIGDGAVDLMEDLGSKYAMIADTVSYSLAAGGVESATNRCPIVYNTEVFRVVESGYEFLTEEGPTEKSQNKRIVTWAILEDITDTNTKGTKIAVFGTHWSIKNNWSTGVSQESLRVQQAQEMAELIQHERFAGMAVIAGGDYNAEHTQTEKFDCYVTLLESADLVDACTSVAADESQIYDGVDHFAVSGCQVESFTVIEGTKDYASDHNPIYCDIKIVLNKIGG